MSRLQSFLKIEPGEGHLVALMLAHSFCIGSARLFTQTSAYALYLAEFGAETLPYVYMGVSLVVTLVSVAYLKLSARLPFSGLLAASVGFLLAALLGLRLALELTQARGLMFALPIFYEVLWTLTNLEFWNLAGRLLNVRQAKRLFGLMGGGCAVAAVIGGLLAPQIIAAIGTPNLLLLAAASTACVLGLVLVISATYADRLAESTTASRLQSERSRSHRTSRYLLSIFGLYALLNIGYYVLDNVFYLQAEAKYPGEEELAGFIGIFLGAVALLTLVSRAFLSGPVLGRYGVRVALLLTPLLLLVGGISASLVGGWMRLAAALFWLAVLTRLLTAVTTEAVDVPAINLLYQPLPPRQRLQTQTMAEGVVYSLSVGLTGLGLSVVTALSAQPTMPFLTLLIFLALAWLAVALQAGRLYPQQLLRALKKRRLGSVDLSLTDAASRAVLQQAAIDRHPAVALYALARLETIGHGSLPGLLQEALNHSAPEVRGYALERIEALRLGSAISSLSRRIAEEPDERVRGAAVRCLAAVGGQGAFKAVVPYLADPSLLVRSAAIAGLFRSQGTEGVTTAGERLLTLAGSAVPAERATAARLLADVPTSSFHRPLLSLLHDPDTEVQRAALWAAGRLGNEGFWPQVVARIGCPPVRRTAAAALVAGGEAALPAMAAAFAQPGGSPEVQARLAQVAGRIGGAQAVSWLEGHLRHSDAGVRSEVLRALSRCAYQAREQIRISVRRQIEAEAEFVVEGLTRVRDLSGSGAAPALPEPAGSLLRRALEGGISQARERVFFLLSFLYDRDTVLRARDNLALAAEKQGYALEVLDLLLGGDLKRVVFSLLTPPSPQQEARHPSGGPGHWNGLQLLADVLSAPAGRTSAWTRATALYAAGAMIPQVAQVVLAGQPAANRLRQAIQTLLLPPKTLVGETATWALYQLDRISPLSAQSGKVHMLTIEKVLALRQASIFGQTSDETLAEIAPLLEEVSLPAGQTILSKGDLGDCMYLIVGGEVRVHDGEHTLNYLQAGDVFGEMAVLTSEPRMASVTAVVETQLLRLDQEALYEVIADHSEVSRGIIGVLCHHLRTQTQELSDLQDRLKMVRAAGGLPHVPEGDVHIPEAPAGLFRDREE